MSVHCVTGQGASPHITGADLGRLNAGIFGESSVVLAVGNRLAATQTSANKVTIATGDAIVHGRHISVTAAEQVTISNGYQNQNRNDLICLKYSRDASGIETASLEVVRGTSTAGEAQDPTPPVGNILKGDTVDYFPLYRIKLHGIAADQPEQLFSVVSGLYQSNNFDLVSCHKPSGSGGSKVFWHIWRTGDIVTIQVQAFIPGTGPWESVDCPLIIPEGSRFKDATERIKQAGGNTGVDQLAGNVLRVPCAMRDSDNTNVHLVVNANGHVHVQNMGGGGHTNGWRWGSLSYAAQN